MDKKVIIITVVAVVLIVAGYFVWKGNSNKTVTLAVPAVTVTQ